jgi:hypothetical protein
VLHQESTQDGPDRSGQGADGRPDSHRPRTLLGRVGVEQQSEARRGERRRTGGLKDSHCHQQPERRADCAADTGESEGHQSEEEATLEAVAVGQSPEGNQQRGVNNGVAVQNPTQVGVGVLVQVLTNVRKGDIDNGEIQRGHEGGRAQHRQYRGGTATLMT